MSISHLLPEPFVASDLPALGPRHSGKVRDWYELNPQTLSATSGHGSSGGHGGGRRAIVVSDRISAFDRILGAIPYKGQVLNELAAFWFSRTRDIVPNHLLRVPDPNVSIVKVCKPWPVEIVVRGYITGVTSTSIWTLYEKGEREMYGLRLPAGLRKNDKLPTPIITPTTKAEHGAHDERITRDEIVARGLVPADVYAQIEQAALALFARGSEICARGGLTLVDTKYEFGDLDGQLMLIDEMHTPDSSRFWLNHSSPLGRGAEGDGEGEGEPINFDKEFIRLWYAERGYRGEGEPPPMTAELIAMASERYIAAYEKITGEKFVPAEYPVNERLVTAAQTW
jgi:phosphoribosylaminoimidazole-succinocarboxamide synthase